MENLQKEKGSVKIKQDDFYRASLTKNGNFMAKNLHDEFVFTSPRAVVLDKQSFINDFVLNPTVQLEVFESVEEKITISGTAAISSGLVHAKFKNKELLTARATMTFVYNGSNWQLLAMQETLIA